MKSKIETANFAILKQSSGRSGHRKTVLTQTVWVTMRVKPELIGET